MYVCMFQNPSACEGFCYQAYIHTCSAGMHTYTPRNQRFFVQFCMYACMSTHVCMLQKPSACEGFGRVVGFDPTTSSQLLSLSRPQTPLSVRFFGTLKSLEKKTVMYVCMLKPLCLWGFLTYIHEETYIHTCLAPHDTGSYSCMYVPKTICLWAFWAFSTQRAPIKAMVLGHP